MVAGRQEIDAKQKLVEEANRKEEQARPRHATPRSKTIARSGCPTLPFRQKRPSASERPKLKTWCQGRQCKRNIHQILLWDISIQSRAWKEKWINNDSSRIEQGAGMSEEQEFQPVAPEMQSVQELKTQTTGLAWNLAFCSQVEPAHWAEGSCLSVCVCGACYKSLSFDAVKNYFKSIIYIYWAYWKRRLDWTSIAKALVFFSALLGAARKRPGSFEAKHWNAAEVACKPCPLVCSWYYHQHCEYIFALECSTEMNVMPLNFYGLAGSHKAVLMKCSGLKRI